MPRTFRICLLLLLASLSFLQGCKLPIAPEVKGVSGLQFNKKNPEQKLLLSMALEVFNPNRYKVKLKSHQFKVFLNGALLGEAASQESQVMRGMSTSAIRFALHTDLKKVLGSMALLAGGFLGGKSEVDLNLSGHIRVRAKGLGKTIPVDFSRTMNLSDAMR